MAAVVCPVCEGTGTQTCYACGGTRILYPTCKYCEGTGGGYRPARFYDIDKHIGDPCHHCRGKGYWTEPCYICREHGILRCYKCHGAGTIEVES